MIFSELYLKYSWIHLYSRRMIVIKIAPYDHLTKQALYRKRLIDLPIFGDECFFFFFIYFFLF